MLAEGKVFGSGTTGIPDNTIVTARFTKHGCLAIADGAAHFYEQAVRMRAWHVHSAAAGVAPGTAIGTAAAFSIHNKKGSAVNVVILWAAMGEISGTLGAGTIDWCQNINLNEAVPTGTAIVARPCLVGGAAPQGGVALESSTLAVAPVPARIFCSLNAVVIATTANNNVIISDLVDGALVLPPGGSVSLQGTAAAGTSPLVVFSALFCEEPI